MATLPAFLRGVAMVLAGRALTVGIARAEADGRRRAGPWATRIAVVWAATFLPVLLVGNPEAVRSCTIAAGLVLALRGVPHRVVFVLAGALLIAALTLAGGAPHPGSLGGIKYALGASWPRGFHDVALVAGLFLLGGFWARAGGDRLFSTPDPPQAPAWLHPLCALGRLPLAALIVHSLAMSAFAASGGPLSAVSVVALSCALLLGEMMLAQRWLLLRKARIGDGLEHRDE
jgi:hypothetical protein